MMPLRHPIVESHHCPRLTQWRSHAVWVLGTWPVEELHTCRGDGFRWCGQTRVSVAGVPSGLMWLKISLTRAIMCGSSMV
jgi:hypothetical protein